MMRVGEVKWQVADGEWGTEEPCLLEAVAMGQSCGCCRVLLHLWASEVEMEEMKGAMEEEPREGRQRPLAKCKKKKK